MFYCGHLMFTWKTHYGLKFHFVQIDQSEICTEVSFTSPKAMRTLIRELPYTKVKFHPKVGSQTGLSLLRVSCKRVLTSYFHTPLLLVLKINSNDYHKLNISFVTTATITELNILEAKIRVQIVTAF